MIFKQSVKTGQGYSLSEHSPSFKVEPDDEDENFISLPAQLLPRDEAQVTFDEMITKICDKKLSLGSKVTRTEFLNRYDCILDQQTRTDRQNFLHVIASRLGHKALTRYVVRMKSHLLHQKDASGRTPLYVAIVYKNYAFLDAILAEFDDTILDLLLREPCENGRNCIHATIQYSLNKEYTWNLILKASDVTISASDQDGLTPLHLAVDYDKSSSSQLSIVRALIARGDGAFDKFSTNPSGLSVYEYHQHTREQANRRNIIGDIRDADAPLLQEAQSGLGTDCITFLSKGRKALDELPVNQSINRGLQSLWKGTAPTLTIMRKQEVNAEMLQEQEKASYADEVRRELKLYYLRTTFERAPGMSKRDQLTASRFLYGPNIQNINLSFNFSQGPMTISKDSFEESYNYMDFDEVLRYVTFRPILLQRPPGPAPGSRLAKKLAQTAKPDHGPNDLVFFFDWLYEKKVRHIFKVVVHDVDSAPHSDMAIEDCLKKFEIEALDWRKVDLSPQTLFNACRNVKEVYLRWSGNTSVLKAWSEQDGLPRLENLERVHLVWNYEQILDKPQPIGSYKDYLQSQLNRAVEVINAARRNAAVNGDQLRRREPIIVCEEKDPISKQPTSPAGPGSIPMNADQRRVQPNRWLSCIDRFADEIQNVKVPRTETEALKSDIKVAIIDDGVDIHIQSLQGKVIGGQSFDQACLDGNGPSPYYSSSGGHGTIMADMVCRVCPNAKVFACKLESHTNPGSRRQISAQSAAMAVMAAVQQKVDIISMSWTLRESENTQAGIDALREAIRAALDANILLFGSASDAGAVTEIEYPCFYDRRVFRIGAAMADGRVYGPTGNPQHLSFVVPGHKVAPRSPYMVQGLPIDLEEKSGSSISTALAAGLAALVLHCIRLGILQAELEIRQTGRRSPTAVRLSDLEKARDYHGMRSILRGVGLNEDNQKYIEIWRRLDGPVKCLKSPSGENADMTALEIVARLARDLVSGIADH
ncbi:hypothetical protein BO71DRAFT_386856 [Aspergillus ellipticus CBS 707.79]|uniref:Peptidase S8/S53 domain-containing protein n=1 Tax=Aspergillus ellipticus CBS 707.79 TaxID=1448320 RepID=A0A319EIL1_9EURO|nr:hypothetical protein BO71DRAFT_386856 [Aspergillus ellipticus CBS 707.79]